MADDVLLNKAASIERCVARASLATSMKQMTGFCNVAVHDYQAVQIPIVIAIINKLTGGLLGACGKYEMCPAKG
ncbi:HepT-like ribonuclease domain-containing protein [Halomonas sp. PGE1]|uniref:HepT-like ribonuclease domain-containing protein n=1 Tax=Halomonas sp. PGE1 TaxID=2730360 RepID=UPI001476586B|nr:HepT-like ribonuclease domain-containing protein [Halomonas sp. PGE1]QJQ99385.1 hypothetical protein HIR79_12275 [Halomonas sp. PGE1]